MSFQMVFGGQTVQPAQLSLRDITLSASIKLEWPLEAATSGVVAENMRVSPTASGFTITMPTALVVSNGEEVLFTNPTSVGFSINDSNGGSLIANMSGGTSRILILRDNTTSAGIWFNILLGSTGAAADASSLAGRGLVVTTTTLSQSHPASFLSANFTVSADDRAQVIIWNGGAGTAETGSASALGNNWFTILRNQGTGTLTVSGPATIDGSTNLTLGVGDSTFLGTTGVVFFTFGKSLTSTSDITALSINLSPGGTTTLSSAQLAARIQTFTGTLSAAAIVEYGTGAGFWMARNQTAGSFTSTFRVNSSDTGAVIAQGGYAILRNDGTNIAIAQDATLFNPGTVSAPGLYIAGSTTTGFFQNSAQSGLSISVGGVERFRANSAHTNIMQSAFITGSLNVSGALTIGTGDLVVNNGRVVVSASTTAVNEFSGRVQFLNSDTDQPALLLATTGAWTTSSIQRIRNSTAAASAWNFLDGQSNNGSDTEFRITGDGWGHADGGWVTGGADVAEFWETMDGQDIKPGRTVVMDKATFKVREAQIGEQPFGVVRPKKGGGVSFIMNAGSMRWVGKYERDAYGAIARKPEGGRVLARDFDPSKPYLARNRRPEWVLVGIMGRVPVDDDAPKGATWLEGPVIVGGVTWWLIR